MPVAIPPRNHFPQEKAEKLTQAKEWYGSSVGVLFADYRGLTVKEAQELRAKLREKGAEAHVLKNTLFRNAAGDDIEKLPSEFHNGTTTYIFVQEDEAGTAKAVFDFAQTHKKLVVKGGFFAGKALSAKEVESLSKLPPKEVLIAQVIGAIAAPLTNLVGVIEALYADPIRVIGAVADKVAEGSPLPVAEAPAAEEPAPVAEEPATEESAPAAEEAAPTEETTPTE